MNLRRATISDIREIKSLADVLVVEPGNLSKVTGFYDYSLTEDQYSHRVLSPFFFIAESHKGLEGFGMAYNSEFAKKLTEQEPLLNEDALLGYLNQLRENYVYIDQLAVKEPGTNKSSLAAYLLINRIINETRNSKIPYLLGAVSHKPWENVSAVRFAKKSGFELQQEINSRGIILGVYKLSL